MSHRITCITKPDRENTHEAIQRVGGIQNNGTSFNITREETYDYIKAGHAFHVVVGRDDVSVIAYQINGVGKYIRTTPDATKKDNLLSLPAC
jgi:hypothetical protein